MNDHIVKTRRSASNVRVLPVRTLAIEVTPMWFRYIASIAALSVLVYIGLVMSIIFATTERKTFESKISDVRTTLSYKEVAYGTKLSELGISKAHELGFVDVTNPEYTSTSATALILRSE